MAISPESYGRGQPVYSNGSHAPTSGTVDPTGYIERGLNNPSDSRSGLAQAALSRLQGGSSATAPSPGVLPLGDIKALLITPTGQLIPQSSVEMPPEPPQQQTPDVSGMPSGPPQLSSPDGSPMSPLAQAALSRVLASGGSINNGGQ